MLHIAGPSQYVEGRGVPMSMLVGPCEGQTGKNQSCSKRYHLNWTSREGEEGLDKSARITTTGKGSSCRERSTPRLAIRHGK